jgi:thioredoxin reductase (NADPH)
MRSDVQNRQVRNAIVVGSGPSGYTAAIYLARANLAPAVFEGAVTAGGALMNTTDVENFPGFPDGIMGPELMDHLRTQAARFGAELITDDVTSLELTGPVKEVVAGGETYRAKTVVLAMGSAYRELGIPGEKELSGHGVSWCATCDGFFFRDQDVAVVGGGDSALEEATFLTRFARKVYLVHRRDTLRASKIMQERAFDNPKIEFVWDTEVVEAVGEAGRLAKVRIRNCRTDEDGELAVTGLFVAVGHDPRSELVRGQVDLDPEGYVRTTTSTATNLDGVFACGDLVDHVYRQAITAAGTGCMAALDAERWLAAREGETATDAGVGATPDELGHSEHAHESGQLERLHS